FLVSARKWMFTAGTTHLGKLADNICQRLAQWINRAATRHTRDFNASQANRDGSSRNVRYRLQEVRREAANSLDLHRGVRLHGRLAVRLRLATQILQGLNAAAVPLQPLNGAEHPLHFSQSSRNRPMPAIRYDRCDRPSSQRRPE